MANWTEHGHPTPEQELETEAREECERRGLPPDEVCADGGVEAWMVVGQEIQRRGFSRGSLNRVAKAIAIKSEGWDKNWTDYIEHAQSAIYAMIKTEPSEPDGEPVAYDFDRYVNGTLMAEGVTIEREPNIEKAMSRAAQIAPRGPNRETPVLIYRPRPE